MPNITFKYKIKASKRYPDQKYIYWSAVWDGKKEEWERHPFCHTNDYLQEYEYYQKALTRFKKHKQKAIYLYTPCRPSKKRIAKNEKLGFVDSRDLCFIFGYDDKQKKYTKEDIEKELNPENILRQVKDVVAYNKATIAICELLSTKTDLEKSCGNHAPEGYKECLLGALSLLWD